MNTKRKITFAVLLLIACGAMSAYADVYHYPDRIEINGEPVMVSGSPWTDSQDADDNNLDNALIHNSVTSNGEKLKFHLGFEGCASTSVYDSRNRNDGDMNNMNLGLDNCTGNCSGCTMYGKFGGGIVFDGLDDFLEVSSLEQDIEDDQEGTISCWVKLNEDSLPDALFMHTDILENDRYLAFVISTGEKVQFTFRRDTGSFGSNYVTVTGDNVLNPDTWYHVAVTSNGTIYKLYVNAEEETLTTSGTNLGKWFGDTATDDYSDFIGKHHTSSSVANFINGTMDEFKYSNRSFTKQELQGEYNLGVSSHPPTGHLLQKAGGNITEVTVGTSTPVYIGSTVGNTSMVIDTGGNVKFHDITYTGALVSESPMMFGKDTGKGYTTFCVWDSDGYQTLLYYDKGVLKVETNSTYCSEKQAVLDKITKFRERGYKIKYVDGLTVISERDLIYDDIIKNNIFVPDNSDIIINVTTEAVKAK